MRSTRHCFCLVVAIVSANLTLTGLTSAQEVAPEWKKIRSALDKRREKFGRFSCRLETSRLAPTFLYEGLEGDPLVKIKGKQDIRVNLKTRSFREVDETPVYYVSGKVFETRVKVNVCNGEECFTYYPNHDTKSQTGNGPYDLTKHPSGRGVSSVTAWPPLRTFGIFRSLDFLKGEITDLPSLGFRFQQQGNEIIANGQIGTREITTYVFDESKDYCLTQISRKSLDGDLNSVTDIQYAKVDGEWQVSGYVTMWPKYGNLAVQVKNFQTHEKLNPELFEIPDDYLQPGMLFSDVTKHERYRVGPNGELLPQNRAKIIKRDQEQTE